MISYLQDEEPRYRKKSRKHGDPRANHKHKYVNCVFRANNIRYDKAHGMVRDGTAFSIGLYCPVCGKINTTIDQKWLIRERGYIGLTSRWSDAALKEFDDRSRTLPVFDLGDEWLPKYIPGYKTAASFL